MSNLVDFTVADHGTVFIVVAFTPEASDFLDARMPDDVLTWAGGCAMEPRYIEPIVVDLLDCGFVVEAV